MDSVQNAFLECTGWNSDNSYSMLNASTRALLDFTTPRGLRMHLSSLSSPIFATSYSLGSLGVVDGSISYLYTTLPLSTPTSKNLDLRSVSTGYRQLTELCIPSPSETEIWQGGERLASLLLYGRMFLPRGTLETLYMHRLGATRQIRVVAVSDSRIKHGGTILGVLQHDVGKWCNEFLYSTDVALLGWRGLYNFGRNPRFQGPPPVPAPKVSQPCDKPVGRFSAGAEVYYGVLNKSAGGLFSSCLPITRQRYSQL